MNSVGPTEKYERLPDFGHRSGNDQTTVSSWISWHTSGRWAILRWNKEKINHTIHIYEDRWHVPTNIAETAVMALYAPLLCGAWEREASQARQRRSTGTSYADLKMTKPIPQNMSGVGGTPTK